MPERYVHGEWSKSPERQNRRVVLTAIGAATPLGHDFQTSWKGLVSGKSGLSNYEMPEYGSEISVIGQVNLNKNQIIDRLKAHNIQTNYPRLQPEINLGIIHRSGQLGLVALTEAL